MGSSVWRIQKSPEGIRTEPQGKFEKSLKEPRSSNEQSTGNRAQKLGIDIRGKTDDQLLEEIQKSTERPKEVPNPEKYLKSEFLFFFTRYLIQV